ncbi:hypothetical protein QFC22_004828 [Naganishia vaughanmartiniae]|uniref:Uncharacterized protein n=1 Tax=Naganishia vaughanmartiniae TaxID=1424756 RepID=A0ACC2X0U5_9TREE|nr:hypothetical protein QFC22_004828 [Naganishia vaughanmartiniae]
MSEPVDETMRTGSPASRADKAAATITTNDAQNGGDAHEEYDDDEEDEEYEIEDILGHQLQKNGQFQYLVSWVGYGPEHNSWTLEQDFGSTDIINDYWNKKGGRPAPNSASKSKRKSTSGTNSKRQVSHTPSTKKRRLSSSPSATGTKEKNGTTGGDKMTIEDHDEPTLGNVADIHKDSMANYKDLSSWEDHVDRISTVERSANNRLVVYLVMSVVLFSFRNAQRVV